MGVPKRHSRGMCGQRVCVRTRQSEAITFVWIPSYAHRDTPKRGWEQAAYGPSLVRQQFPAGVILAGVDDGVRQSPGGGSSSLLLGSVPPGQIRPLPLKIVIERSLPACPVLPDRLDCSLRPSVGGLVGWPLAACNERGRDNVLGTQSSQHESTSHSLVKREAPLIGGR
jgi:hypothetical protein